MSNFEFLKKTDVNLFKIANEAEKLYRDEYFEQCITQTRRFAENICKNMLAPELTIGATFDDTGYIERQIEWFNKRKRIYR